MARPRAACLIHEQAGGRGQKGRATVGGAAWTQGQTETLASSSAAKWLSVCAVRRGDVLSGHG